MKSNYSRHIYLRQLVKMNGEFKLQHPIGCVAMKVDRDNKKVSYGLSACSPKDKWHRTAAVGKATKRLEESPTILEGDIPESCHDITRMVMQHIISTNQEQGKDRSRSLLALEGASNWISMANQNVEAKES